MPLATQLSEDQIAEMIRLRQEGRGIKAVALQFHIGPDRVRRLVAGVNAPAPPAPPAIIRLLPVRVVEQLDDGDDEGDDEAVDEARPDDDAVDEFIAAFEGVAPLVRSFLARGPGNYQAEALVDATDYDRVMRGPAWRLQRVYGKAGPAIYYVVRGRGELLHRVVMADELAAWTGPGRAVVDHANGNRLDNRRCNLRVVTQRENRANSLKSSSPTSSRFKGVTLYKGRCVAQIRRHGQQVYLGYFDSEEDAARAYDDAARAEYGEYACLNFAREGERSALPPQSDNEQPQPVNETRPTNEPQSTDEPQT